ncbi:MAG: YtxH domain-containing protein [Bacillus sp. (in: Bacteria)]|nr:YtxH domain-containing protein [Bacillus sp. (in: firmicutes)]
MENEGKEKKGNWVRNGILIGAAIGSIYIVSNKKTRTKIVDGVGNCTDKAKNWVTFVRENKEPFLEQMRATSNKIAEIVEEATDDIQTLMETSQHMKDHTLSLFQALQETKDEFQTLTERLKGEGKLDMEEVLPPSDSQGNDGEGKLLQ